MQKLVVDIADTTDGALDVVAAANALLSAGDEVSLFHSMYHPALESAEQHPGDALVGEAQALLIARREAQLAEMTESFSAFNADGHVDWTSNGWQALLQYARKKEATLVIARSDRPTRWRPLAKANDDWQLIRHADVPLLLTRPVENRESRTAAYRTILAAVDPLHADDKPAELDHRILEHASALATRHGASLCVLNVVPPMTAGAPVTAIPVQSVEPQRLAAHRERLEGLVEETQCHATKLCVVPGAPAQCIIDHAEEHKADLVVMGAVSRSMLRNALIGNTAEKVLNHLDADTLIIKPAAPGNRMSPYLPSLE